jgi:hypothetical protein
MSIELKRTEDVVSFSVFFSKLSVTHRYFAIFLPLTRVFVNEVYLDGDIIMIALVLLGVFGTPEYRR